MQREATVRRHEATTQRALPTPTPADEDERGRGRARTLLEGARAGKDATLLVSEVNPRAVVLEERAREKDAILLVSEVESKGGARRRDKNERRRSCTKGGVRGMEGRGAGGCDDGFESRQRKSASAE